jgi:hypothetical protein
VDLVLKGLNDRLFLEEVTRIGMAADWEGAKPGRAGHACQIQSKQRNAQKNRDPLATPLPYKIHPKTISHECYSDAKFELFHGPKYFWAF